MMRCFETGRKRCIFLILSQLSRRLFHLSNLEAYPIAHLYFFHFEFIKMTILTLELFFCLSLFFLTSVYADYVVYPRIRSNLRLNSAVTDSIISLLGAENVQTFMSRPRQVYEYWLIKATDSQVVVVRGMVGVSTSMPVWGWIDWNADAEFTIVGRRSLEE